MQSQPKDEKFTPKKYIDSVKKVFGGEIDLDPFSSELGNSRIKALKYYDIAANGFEKPWFGKVFANSPYSRGNLQKAVFKADLEFKHMKETKEIILLTPNSTDAKWFQPLWNYPICFTNHRISFLVWNGIKFVYEKNPENGSCFVYFGKNVYKFAEEFNKYGYIVNRYNYLDTVIDSRDED